MKTNVLKHGSKLTQGLFIFLLSLSVFWVKAQSSLIGMTQFGGSFPGVSFNYDLTTAVYNSTPFNSPTNGAAPNGSYFKASDGNIYGMVTYNSYGFFVSGNGHFVKYNPNAGTITSLFQFSGSSGSYPGRRPQGALIEATPGVLYGLTDQGGANNEGVIFSYTLSSGTYSVLYDFNSTSNGGTNPIGSLLKASNGLLYGVTSQGGSSGNGVMFSFNLTTNTYAQLFSFSGNTGSNPGASPLGTLIEPTTGVLWGLAPYGGTNGDGVIFNYTIATSSYAVKYNFSAVSGGANPEGSLVKATNNKLYGLTSSGGSSNDGVMFEYDMAGAGTYNVLFNFSGAASPYEGSSPRGSLMQAANGHLYGMTQNGGATGAGVLFRYNLTSSTYSMMLNFTGSGGTYSGANPTHGHLIEVTGVCPYPSVTSTQIFDANCNGGNDGSATVTAVGAVSYNWLPSGGTSNSAINLTAGVYTCAITNACGTTSETLTVNEPTALFLTATASNPTVCSGNSSTLTATAGGGMGLISFTWTGGSNNYTTVVNPSTTTTYTIDIADGNGCALSNTVTVAIGSGTIPVVSVNSGTICAGQSFVIVPSGAATYTIQGGSTTVNPTSNSTYTVIGESAQGCLSSNTATSSVTVNSVPTVSATTSASLLCAGQTATLTASGAATYSWSTTSSNTVITVSPSSTTVYTVTGIAANSCSNTAVITQSVSACTGLALNKADANEISVYPNPFNGKVSVLIESNNEETFQVFNALGKMVYSGKLKETKSEIDLSEQPKGIYFLKVGNATRKLIKE